MGGPRAPDGSCAACRMGALLLHTRGNPDWRLAGRRLIRMRQESGVCAYLVQQLLRYGFDHPSRTKWDPSATMMLGIGMPIKFPTAGSVAQLLKTANGMPQTLLTGNPILDK